MVPFVTPLPSFHSGGSTDVVVCTPLPSALTGQLSWPNTVGALPPLPPAPLPPAALPATPAAPPPPIDPPELPAAPLRELAPAPPSVVVPDVGAEPPLATAPPWAEAPPPFSGGDAGSEEQPNASDAATRQLVATEERIDRMGVRLLRFRSKS